MTKFYVSVVKRNTGNFRPNIYWFKVSAKYLKLYVSIVKYVTKETLVTLDLIFIDLR